MCPYHRLVHAQNQHKKTWNRSSHVPPSIKCGQWIHKQNGNDHHLLTMNQTNKNKNGKLCPPCYCFAGQWFHGLSFKQTTTETTMIISCANPLLFCWRDGMVQTNTNRNGNDHCTNQPLLFLLENFFHVWVHESNQTQTGNDSNAAKGEEII